MQLNLHVSARFAAGLGAIWPDLAQEGARLALAVSGGPDSLALLLLAHAALPHRIAVATVDHGLRRESADEAAGVAQICAQLHVPHTTLKVQLAAGNIQAEARHARYASMAQWMQKEGLAALATGHHADDQAETVILRLNRGAGVGGLAGVRTKGQVPGSELPLIRPLLDWRRAELAAVVADTGFIAVDDPSNANDRFDRARLRKNMADAEWLDVPMIAASASHMADADAALDWAAAREWAECVSAAGLSMVYRPTAPRAVALRVVARIVAQMDGDEARGAAVARLFSALLTRQTSSIGNLVVRPTPAGWSFMKAPKRRS